MKCLQVQYVMHGHLTQMYLAGGLCQHTLLHRHPHQLGELVTDRPPNWAYLQQGYHQYRQLVARSPMSDSTDLQASVVTAWCTVAQLTANHRPCITCHTIVANT
jgi:hypothetical protein